MNESISEFSGDLQGVLLGSDPLPIRFGLLSIAYPEGIMGYLSSAHILLKDFWLSCAEDELTAEGGLPSPGSPPDLVFRDPAKLRQLYPRLVHHSPTSFGSRKGLPQPFEGEVIRDLQERRESTGLTTTSTRIRSKFMTRPMRHKEACTGQALDVWAYEPFVKLHSSIPESRSRRLPLKAPTATCRDQCPN